MAELLKLVAPLGRQLFGPYPGGRFPARSRVRSSDSPPSDSGSEPESPLLWSVSDSTRPSLQSTPYQLHTDTSFSQFFFDFQPSMWADVARSTSARQSAGWSLLAHGWLFRFAATVAPLSRTGSTRSTFIMVLKYRRVAVCGAYRESTVRRWYSRPVLPRVPVLGYDRYVLTYTTGVRVAAGLIM